MTVYIRLNRERVYIIMVEYREHALGARNYILKGSRLQFLFVRSTHLKTSLNAQRSMILVQLSRRKERRNEEIRSKSPSRSLHALPNRSLWLPRSRASHSRNRPISRRRKSTVQRYEQPYVQRPPQRSYMVPGNAGNHHPGHAVLDDVHNKILNFNSMPNSRYDDRFVAYLANTVGLEIDARAFHAFLRYVSPDMIDSI